MSDQCAWTGGGSGAHGDYTALAIRGSLPLATTPTGDTHVPCNALLRPASVTESHRLQ